MLDAIGGKSVDENASLDFAVSASDPDGGLVTITAEDLPAGATFDGTDFSWATTYADAGTYDVTFTATSGLLTDSETITITVTNVDRAPVLDAIGGKSVDENASLDFAVSASDPDGGLVTITAEDLPAGATFDGTDFSWATTYADAGTYDVTFTATSGLLTDSETITITVTNVDRAPVLDAIGGKSVDENASLDFAVSASDPDGDLVTITAEDLPAGATFDGTDFSWATTYADAGTYDVTFTATSGLLTDSETITITVTNVDRAPVLDAIGGKSVDENASLDFAVSASDPDGGLVTVTAEDLPAGATFDGTDFSWATTYADAGTYDVTFTATSGLLTDSETITITVTNVDRAPVLDAIGGKSVDENASLDFAVSASDPDGGLVTVTAEDLPAGATFDGTDFSWATTYADAGNYDVTFTATSGLLTDSETITITVTNVDRAPVLDAIGGKSVDENASLDFAVSASDPDGGLVTVTAEDLPAGATFDGTDFSWATTYADAGTYDVTFTATSGLLTDSETITITVTNVDRAPVLDAIGGKSVDENASLDFAVSASDPDGGLVTITAEDLPAGATFDGTDFSWATTYADAGTYDVTFTATSGLLTDSETITITVNNVDRAPVLDAIGGKSVDENASLDFAVSASDPDGGLVTITAEDLPAGATFDGTDFSWATTYADAGTYDVTFTATSGLLTDSETITITVNNVDRAPVLDAIGGKSVDENASLDFAVSASDPDGGLVTITAEDLPAGATFDGTDFSWATTYADAGTYDVTFTATSGLLTDSETITITVTNVDRAPVLDAIGGKSVDENASLDFAVSASDPDGGLVTITAEDLPAGATFDGTDFSWATTYADAGTYDVTFTATSGLLTDSETITITVNNVDRAPVLDAIGGKSVDENASLDFAVSASDPDGGLVTITAEDLPAGATFDGTDFSWATTYADAGTYDVTFTATSGLLTDSETITITVNNVDRAPVLDAIGGKSVDENASLDFAVSASDPDGGLVTVTAEDLPAGATFDGTDFSWATTYADAGTYDVTFTATSGLLTDSETITITVNNVDRAPVLDAIGGKSVDENASLDFAVSASDPDGGLVTITAEDLPAGATFDGTDFSWATTYADAGTYDVTFTATSGLLTDSETITITVNNVDRAPVLDAIGGKSVDENASLDFAVSASDPDGGLVTITAEDLPAGATFDGTDFSWATTYADAGTYDVTFTATSGLLTDSETITITVNNVDRAPVLDAIGGKSVDENASLDFAVSASDPDGGLVTITAEDLPAGATFDGTDFSWATTYADAGTYDVTFTATSGLLTDSETITITVNNVDRAPVLDAIGGKSVDENASLDFAVSASDPDGGLVTITAEDLPAGATFDGTDFSWATTYADAGTYDVTFTATSGLLTDSETITITVNNVDRAPVAVDDTASTDEDVAVEIDAVANDTDADGDALFVTAVADPDNGTAAIVAGKVIYTPDANWSGAETFAYTVSDGELTDDGEITVEVIPSNQAPVAVDDAASTDEDTAVEIDALANDTDVDADALYISAVGDPDNGTAAIVAGNVVYTPDANWSGTETFAYTVSDGELTDDGGITVTVAAVNDPPTADAKTVTTDEDIAVGVTLSGDDIDGDALTFAIVDAPAHGMLTGSGGVLTYTPAANYNGSDSFTYVANDGTVDSAPAAVGIAIAAVNDAPVITALTVPITPTAVDRPVNVTGTFTDPDSVDTHTALWTWGDGTTSPGAVGAGGTVSGSHAYEEAGVYTVKLTVTDAAGSTATMSAIEYTVIYDPAGGFVTGGGWFNSPAGAYREFPTTSGKAVFGFVSRYKKGATVPTGNTEFVLLVTPCNMWQESFLFSSTSYEWLVVTGNKAQYKGEGKINCRGSYRFILTATDGSPDKLRMKIWDKVTNELVYDNKLNAPDTADPTTAIQGSIQIHK